MISDEAVSQEFDSALDWVEKATDLVSEYFDDEEKASEIEALDKTFQEICTTDLKFKVSQDWIATLEDKYTEYKDLKSALDELIESEIREGKLDYKEHPRFIEWTNKINPTEEKNLGDEDLVCTSTDVNIIDPYTKKVIKQPITNTICGHYYEKASVFELLKGGKKLRCPYAGCRSEKFSKDNLVEDRQLTKQIQQQVQASQAVASTSSSALNIAD